MRIKACKYCGKKFATDKNKIICGSSECRKAYDKERHSKKKSICETCGKEFSGTRRYCSEECKKIGISKNITLKRICPVCGKEFESSKMFCSKECENKHKADLAKSKTYIKECAYCGEEFETHYNKTIYCSSKCASRKQADNIYNSKIEEVKERIKQISNDLSVINIEKVDNSYKKTVFTIFCNKCRQTHTVKGNSVLCFNKDSKRYVGCKCGDVIGICKQCGKEFTKKYGTINLCNECKAQKEEIKRIEKEKEEEIKRIEKEKEKEIKAHELEVRKQEALKAKEEARRKHIEEYESKEYTCKYCGEKFYLIYGGYKSKVYCCKEHANKMNNSNHCKHRENKMKANGNIDKTITLAKLIKKDNNICQICGKPCDSNDYKIVNDVHIAGDNYPSIDHIVPIAKGGTHTWGNVQLVHRICNSMKSDNI